jgi:group I intron endonuclease
MAISQYEILYSIGFSIPWFKDRNDIMKKGGIYLIKNEKNSKIYIGSTKIFYRRYQRHRKPLLNNIHVNKHLQNSFNKYKDINFTFNIIEIVNDFDKLIEREQYWLDLLQAYNSNIGFNNIDVAGPSMMKGKLRPEHWVPIGNLFKKGNISWNKGRSLSIEERKIISDKIKSLNIRGSKLPQSRSVKILEVQTGNIVEFESISDTTKKIGYDRKTLINAFLTNKLLRKKHKVINISYGKYIRQAS